MPTGELRWSDQTYTCFGYTPGKVIPSFELFESHIHEQDRALVQAKVQLSLAQGSEYEVEFRFRRVDGSARIGRATGHVERDLQGTSLTLSGAMQDITVLRQSEQRFKVAFRASPLAASIARMADGVFVDVNDKYEKYFGWTANDILGRSSVDIGLWTDKATRDVWIDELKRHNTTLDFESQWRNKRGELRQVSTPLN